MPHTAATRSCSGRMKSSALSDSLPGHSRKNFRAAHEQGARLSLAAADGRAPARLARLHELLHMQDPDHSSDLN